MEKLGKFNWNVSQDDKNRGEQALFATGKVPTGFEFATNVSKDEEVLKGIVEGYESRGYDVVVLRDLEYDDSGRHTSGDAVVIKKRTV